MSKLLNWDSPKVNAKYKAETINGISYTLWKQALWKYIHRIDLGLGTLNILKCVKEKKMKSNLLNNIILMMTEEVSINNATLPIAMKELYLLFKSTEDFTYVKKMYILISNSDKCRLITDIKATFILTPYPIKDLNYLATIHKKMAPEYGEMYNFTYTLEETLVLMKECLLSDDRSKSLMYLSYYIRVGYIKLSGAQKLWRMLHQVIVNQSPILKDIIESLRYFYVNISREEKIYYLYQAFLTVIYRDTIDLTLNDHQSVSTEIQTKFPLKETTFIEIEEESECTKFKSDVWRNYYVTFNHLLSLYNENVLEEEPEGSTFLEYTEDIQYAEEEIVQCLDEE